MKNGSNNERPDPVTSLLDLVRTAAREGATQALASPGGDAGTTTAPLVDKRTLAHALGVSTASVDRLCREGRIPFVLVGEVRRFDLDAVRAALEARAPQGSSKPASQGSR